MEQEIKSEINRCLGCINKPCVMGCPLNNEIRDIISLMKDEKYEEAYILLCSTTVLGSICGRICPYSRQCEGSCIRKYNDNVIEIGKIESFLSDMAIKNNWEIPLISNKGIGKKVAVIGGGPSGLTCAAFLKRNGFDVTIYEKHLSLGGVIEHGIPEFRLDKETINKSINKIIDLNIRVETNKELGKDIYLRDLENNYDAVFLGLGKNISSKMNIEGEDLNGVFGGNELLEYKDFPDFKNKKVAVIGGGNVAMDASRTIKRLGAENVTIIYRRSREEMPAEDKEIEDALNEGIDILYQTNIVKIIGDKKVEKIECIKTELVEKEEEPRKVPVNIENSNYDIDLDYVVMAVGSKTDKELLNSLGLELNDNYCIKINENYQTSNPKIFAAGDLSIPKGTVAWAARTGRDAADSIINYLCGD